MTKEREELFKMQLEREIEHIEYLLAKIEKEHVENEQYVLDFLDKLNKLSVKY